MQGRVRFAVVAGVALAALVAACSPGGEPASAAPTPTPTASTTTVRVYFYLGGEPGSDGLVPVERTVTEGDALEGALNALLAGSTSAEAGDRTISSAIPEGSRLLGVTLADGVAGVDLSREFESGGGSMSMFVRLSQVVFTATQFPSVDSVLFKIEGQPVTVFSSEGIVLDGPQTRADGADQLPAIFVDHPAYGAALGNPARISGTANVFEAAFRVTILDAAGKTVADVPALASCGTGCRGSFDLSVPYPVDRAQTGTLRAWEPSAKDGSPVNVREYPVGLVPAG